MMKVRTIKFSDRAYVDCRDFALQIRQDVENPEETPEGRKKVTTINGIIYALEKMAEDLE